MIEVATLGGGCFWCLDAVYEGVKGVASVEAGYMGGRRANPSYEEVSMGVTGHIEVVQITFDPAAVTFRELLEVFFVIHDPTTPDRQGNDVGEQYRSVIFYHSDDQKKAAEEIIEELNQSGALSSPVVTDVRPAETFWAAEEYHQHYFRKNPKAGYCQFVVRPKVDKFRAKFEELRSVG